MQTALFKRREVTCLGQPGAPASVTSTGPGSGPFSRDEEINCFLKRDHRPGNVLVWGWGGSVKAGRKLNLPQVGAVRAYTLMLASAQGCGYSGYPAPMPADSHRFFYCDAALGLQLLEPGCSERLQKLERVGVSST